MSSSRQTREQSSFEVDATRDKLITVGTITELDTTERVYLNAAGQFYTLNTKGEQVNRSETLDGTRDALRASLMARKRKATKVSVRVTLIGHGGTRNAQTVELTGTGKGNNTYGGEDVLIRDSNGTADRISSSTTVYQPFTIVEMGRYAELLQAQRDADRAMSKFLSERKLKHMALGVVEEARAAAVAAAVEAGEEQPR